MTHKKICLFSGTSKISSNNIIKRCILRLSDDIIMIILSYEYGIDNIELYKLIVKKYKSINNMPNDFLLKILLYCKEIDNINIKLFLDNKYNELPLYYKDRYKYRIIDWDNNIYDYPDDYIFNQKENFKYEYNYISNFDSILDWDNNIFDNIREERIIGERYLKYNNNLFGKKSILYKEGYYMNIYKVKVIYKNKIKIRNVLEINDDIMKKHFEKANKKKLKYFTIKDARGKRIKNIIYNKKFNYDRKIEIKDSKIKWIRKPNFRKEETIFQYGKFIKHYYKSYPIDNIPYKISKRERKKDYYIEFTIKRFPYYEWLISFYEFIPYSINDSRNKLLKLIS